MVPRTLTARRDAASPSTTHPPTDPSLIQAAAPAWCTTCAAAAAPPSPPPPPPPRLHLRTREARNRRAGRAQDEAIASSGTTAHHTGVSSTQCAVGAGVRGLARKRPCQNTSRGPRPDLAAAPGRRTTRPWAPPPAASPRVAPRPAAQPRPPPLRAMECSARIVVVSPSLPRCGTLAPPRTKRLDCSRTLTVLLLLLLSLLVLLSLLIVVVLPAHRRQPVPPHLPRTRRAATQPARTMPVSHPLTHNAAEAMQTVPRQQHCLTNNKPNPNPNPHTCAPSSPYASTSVPSTSRSSPPAPAAATTAVAPPGGGASTMTSSGSDGPPPRRGLGCGTRGAAPPLPLPCGAPAGLGCLAPPARQCGHPHGCGWPWAAVEGQPDSKGGGCVPLGLVAGGAPGGGASASAGLPPLSACSAPNSCRCALGARGGGAEEGPGPAALASWSAGRLSFCCCCRGGGGGPRPPPRPPLPPPRPPPPEGWDAVCPCLPPVPDAAAAASRCLCKGWCGAHTQAGGWRAPPCRGHWRCCAGQMCRGLGIIIAGRTHTWDARLGAARAYQGLHPRSRREQQEAQQQRVRTQGQDAALDGAVRAQGCARAVEARFLQQAEQGAAAAHKEHTEAASACGAQRAGRWGAMGELCQRSQS